MKGTTAGAVANAKLCSLKEETQINRSSFHDKVDAEPSIKKGFI